MTSRRPHWDDDLVDAVIDLQYHCVDCMEDDYPDIDQRDPDAVNKAWAHEVIAAVEDWQKERFKWSDIIQSPFEVAVRHNAAEERAEKAEAAVQRVREVCADQCFWAEHGPDAGLVNAVTVESILDALEGDSE